MNTGKRKSPSIKFVLKMLVWMLIGGILGFAMSWFGGQADNVGQFFAVVVRSVQSAMIPLVTLVTVSGILFGEIVLKKIKQIEERLRYAEDEECDELEYQEEYIGAWGLNGSNFAMALAILINSVGYSRNYISGSRETAFRFMIAVVIFVVCFFYEGLWQMRYVKVIQSSRPEFSNADPSSMKFQEQWMKSCDEAEKEMIYHSSYRTYLFFSKVIPILLVAAMLSNLLFDTGMLAIVLLAVLWIMTSMYYTRSCVNMRKKRARG